MKLTLQQKEQFFHEFSSGLAAGLPFREVLERGSKRRNRVRSEVCRKMLARAPSGDGSAAAAFESLPETFDSLDLSMVRAGETSGQLDAIGKSLAEYYGSLAKAKRSLIKQLIYPLFLVHFGILVLAAPTGVSLGLNAYLREILIAFAAFYAVTILLALIVTATLRALKVSSWVERVVHWIPLLGGVRHALICTRFSLVLAMLVKAGAGILAAFERAGDASGSALFRVGARRTVESVRAGEPLGTAVTGAGCFPEEICEAMHTADSSGRLDVEMMRVGAFYQEQFISRLDTLASWLPRLFYLAVVIFIALKILEVARGYYSTINQMLDGM